MLSFYLFMLSFYHYTTLANPVPPACMGKSVCFEKGDRGVAFVLSPMSRNFEVVCHDSWDKVDAEVACKEAKGMAHPKLPNIVGKTTLRTP